MMKSVGNRIGLHGSTCLCVASVVDFKRPVAALSAAQSVDIVRAVWSCAVLLLGRICTLKREALSHLCHTTQTHHICDHVTHCKGAQATRPVEED